MKWAIYDFENDYENNEQEMNEEEVLEKAIERLEKQIELILNENNFDKNVKSELTENELLYV